VPTTSFCWSADGPTSSRNAPDNELRDRLLQYDISLLDVVIFDQVSTGGRCSN